MSRIEFDKPTRDALVRALSRYMKEELDVELGGFDAGFLFDFVAETLGPHFYNQGLQDAQALFRGKLEAVIEAVYEIEQPIRSV